MGDLADLNQRMLEVEEEIRALKAVLRRFRQSSLANVDAIERAQKMEPRTAEIRKGMRQ